MLKRYRDCFAWNYHKVLGLKRNIVDHGLSIKTRFSLHKQPLRRSTLEVVVKIKEEIERLFMADFIRTAKYVERVEILQNIYW